MEIPSFFMGKIIVTLFPFTDIPSGMKPSAAKSSVLTQHPGSALNSRKVPKMPCFCGFYGVGSNAEGKLNCINAVVITQKCFTVDFLTKKRKVNEGEVPQYYVKHSHEPIITPEEFDKVQTELARRKQISRQYSGKSIFSSRIVCGDCGSYFGSKVWNSTSKYRRVIWQCNSKFKGEHKCETPHLDEETIKARFVTALNAIIESKDDILEDCRLMQTTLTDCTGIDTEIESLLEEIDVVTELTKRCIAENSQMAQN